jgi:hypothetical protein
MIIVPQADEINLPSLETLELAMDSGDITLPDLSRCTTLKNLHLHNVAGLDSLPPLPASLIRFTIKYPSIYTRDENGFINKGDRKLQWSDQSSLFRDCPNLEVFSFRGVVRDELAENPKNRDHDSGRGMGGCRIPKELAELVRKVESDTRPYHLELPAALCRMASLRRLEVLLYKMWSNNILIVHARVPFALLQNLDTLTLFADKVDYVAGPVTGVLQTRAKLQIEPSENRYR